MNLIKRRKTNSLLFLVFIDNKYNNSSSKIEAKQNSPIKDKK